MTITEVDRDDIFLMFALTETARALEQLRYVRILSAVRQERSPGVEVRELGAIFDAIRLMLHFTGSVSRIFWSPGRSNIAKARSGRLRKKIGLAENHSLSLRALRDHVEHIDERLDQWTALTPRPFTTVEIVLYDDSHELTREQILASVAFIFDQAADAVIIFGDTFALKPIESALSDVQELISLWLSGERRSDTWAL